MRKITVVAKYRENTNWCNNIEHIIIKKDKDVPNKGREASSYAWYIIQNYDNLPDNITFCQGYPFDHVKSIDCDFTDRIMPHGDILVCNKDGSPHHYGGLQLEKISNELGIKLPDKIEFIRGAQFTVHKNLILKHPRSFYLKLFDLANDFPEGPFCFERLWLLIFS